MVERDSNLLLITSLFSSSGHGLTERCTSNDDGEGNELTIEPS